MKNTLFSYTTAALLIILPHLQAEPSAFFKQASKNAQEQADHFSKRREINPDAAEYASHDVAMVAQAASNVGINVRNNDFKAIIWELVKTYNIETEFIEPLITGALKGIKPTSHSSLIAQAKGIEQAIAKEASKQAIATYACALAAGAHPRLAQMAAAKAIKNRSISSVLAQKIAQACATDAGIIVRTKGLIDLVKSITTKHVKKMASQAATVNSTQACPYEKTTNEKFSLLSISNKGEVYVRLENDGKWVSDTHELEASCEILTSVAINDRGFIWMVSKTGGIFFQDGLGPDDERITLIGTAKQIAVNNNNTVWMLSTDGTLYYRAGITVEKPEGDRWELVSNGNLTIKNISWISLNDHNDLVIIADGKAYLRKSTHKNPRGNGWTEISSVIKTDDGEFTTNRLKQIVINNQRDIWALSEKNKILFRNETSDKLVNGTSWQQIPGALHTLMVAPDGTLWGIDTKSHLFTRTNISDSNRQGTDWKYLMTAPTFAHLFISNYHLQDESGEYKADKSRREGNRSRNVTIERLKRRFAATEKELQKAHGYQKKALKKKALRLKKQLHDREAVITKRKQEAAQQEEEAIHNAKLQRKKTPKKQKPHHVLPVTASLKPGSFSALTPAAPVLKPGTYSVLTPAAAPAPITLTSSSYSVLTPAPAKALTQGAVIPAR